MMINLRILKMCIRDRPTLQPAAPAQTQSAAKPAPSAPAAPAASSASKSIEDIRGMLAKKVNEHRDVIKMCIRDSYCGDGITAGALLSPNEGRWMTSFVNDVTVRDCIFDYQTSMKPPSVTSTGVYSVSFSRS